MRGRMLMRMLMMFGPMIFRQFKKFQNKKARQERFPEDEVQQDVQQEYTDESAPKNRKYKKDEFV